MHPALFLRTASAARAGRWFLLVGATCTFFLGAASACGGAAGGKARAGKEADDAQACQYLLKILLIHGSPPLCPVYASSVRRPKAG